MHGSFDHLISKGTAAVLHKHRDVCATVQGSPLYGRLLDMLDTGCTVDVKVEILPLSASVKLQWMAWREDMGSDRWCFAAVRS